MLNLARGSDIEGREPHLSSVLHAGKEVEDLLLLLDNAFLLLAAVGDALALEDAVPILVGDFYLVLDGGDVLQLGLLSHADELLDVTTMQKSAILQPSVLVLP